MKTFIIALSALSLALAQDMTNQLEHQNLEQFHQQQQQQQQIFAQNMNFRSAAQPEAQPQPEALPEPQSQGNEQRSPAHHGGEVVIISNNQDPHFQLSHSQQQQILKVVSQQNPQHEKVIVQVGPPAHSHEKLVIHQQPQPIHHQPQQIKVVEVDKKKEVVVHHQNACHLLGRKGECISIPNYFGCIRNGGLIFMSVTECGFNTGFGCCVKNIVPFLSQSK